jgi:hypothetical protein
MKRFLARFPAMLKKCDRSEESRLWVRRPTSEGFHKKIVSLILLKSSRLTKK